MEIDHGTYLKHNLKLWADKNDFCGEIKGGSVIVRPDILIVSSNYSID